MLAASATCSLRMRFDRNPRSRRHVERPASWLERVNEALRRAALSRRLRKLDRAIAQAATALRDAERHSWMALKRQAAECARLCIERAALRARLDHLGATTTSADPVGDSGGRQAGTPGTATEADRRAARR